MMKKLTYSIVFIGWLLVVTGLSADRLMNPGAGEAVGSIGALLLFLFVPLLVLDINKMTRLKPTYQRLTWMTGTLGVSLGGLGFVIKGLHLPGAYYVMGSSWAILTLVLPPLLIFALYKYSQSLNKA